ncbi:cytoskeletal protein binding protein [Cladochytrium tenue]|nr:cytoskeletal protein binding protein [Cladochytrium tenue]
MFKDTGFHQNVARHEDYLALKLGLRPGMKAVKTLRAVQDLYEAGVFVELGLSNYAAWQVARIYALCKENGYVRPTIYQATNRPKSGSEKQFDSMSESFLIDVRTNDASGPNEANLRMWNDKSGNFQVPAEFLTVVDGKAHLHKTNGVKIAVPLDQLSPPDIAFVSNIPGYQNISVSKTSGDAGPERPKFDPAEVAATISAKLAASAPPTATVIYNGFDWRDWLLKAGVSSTDATTYAQAFVSEKMDRSVLGDLDRDVLKALNVSEGDIIRIRKYASTSVPSGSGAFIVEKERAASAGSAAFSSSDQIRMDEELAREQQQELEGTTRSTVEKGSRFDPETTQGQRYRARYMNDMYLEAANVAREASSEYGVSLAAAAHRWLLHHSLLDAAAGDAVIIGVSSLEHARSNLLDCEGGPLPQKLVDAFDDGNQITKGVQPNYFR